MGFSILGLISNYVQMNPRIGPTYQGKLSGLNRFSYMKIEDMHEVIAE